MYEKLNLLIDEYLKKNDIDYLLLGNGVQGRHSISKKK